METLLPAGTAIEVYRIDEMHSFEPPESVDHDIRRKR